MATANPTPTQNGTALAPAAPVNTELAAPLAESRMDQARYDLIRAVAARGVEDAAQIAAFIELAAKYDLDPLAREVWCADGGNGRTLVMVGRDGLRKIAHRQGLAMDCDVVREGDSFLVVRGTDRSRVIEHKYSGGERGEIVGAWAEVFDPETGRQLGYYYAPLHEWMPTSEGKLKHSPWGSQTSVMILAAAERQALRQATPLGGLLAEGELDRGQELAGPEPVELAAPADVDHGLVSLLEDAALEGVLTPDALNMELVAHGAQTTESVEGALRSMPPTHREALGHKVADLIAAAQDREALAADLEDADHLDPSALDEERDS